jgi:DNA-binding winged helix-turn-helix (wHTH) protein
LSASTINSDESGGKKNGEKIVIDLISITDLLDNIKKNHPLNKIMLKIDCEGEEYSIFESLSKTEYLNNVCSIVVEWHEYGPEKIKAVLKRNEETHREEVNAEFDMGKYHFNPRLRELTIDGKINVLSPKENELLKMLCEHKNDLLTREAALKKIWGSDTYFNGRSMDVYIAKLRKYLKEDETIEIVNIHGNGFRLVAA